LTADESDVSTGLNFSTAGPCAVLGLFVGVTSCMSCSSSLCAALISISPNLTFSRSFIPLSTGDIVALLVSGFGGRVLRGGLGVADVDAEVAAGLKLNDGADADAVFGAALDAGGLKLNAEADATDDADAAPDAAGLKLPNAGAEAGAGVGAALVATGGLKLKADAGAAAALDAAAAAKPKAGAEAGVGEAAAFDIVGLKLNDGVGAGAGAAAALDAAGATLKAGAEAVVNAVAALDAGGLKLNAGVDADVDVKLALDAAGWKLKAGADAGAGEDAALNADGLKLNAGVDAGVDAAAALDADGVRLNAGVEAVVDVEAALVSGGLKLNAGVDAVVLDADGAKPNVDVDATVGVAAPKPNEVGAEARGCFTGSVVSAFAGWRSLGRVSGVCTDCAPTRPSSSFRFAHFNSVILPSVVVKRSTGPFASSGALLS
jgi:hypothetical protein